MKAISWQILQVIAWNCCHRDGWLKPNAWIGWELCQSSQLEISNQVDFSNSFLRYQNISQSFLVILLILASRFSILSELLTHIFISRKSSLLFTLLNVGIHSFSKCIYNPQFIAYLYKFPYNCTKTLYSSTINWSK